MKKGNSIKLDLRELNYEILETASDLIKRDKLVCYPTDTSYGLGSNALSTVAVEKVFSIKKRLKHSPIHLCVSDIEMAQRYAYFDEIAIKIAKKFLPGPLTIILRKKRVVPDILTANLPSVGIRIPDHPIPILLSKMTNLPITATSANLSGKPDAYNASTVVEYFQQKIDLILDVGELPKKKPSTILDLTVTPYKILRKGPISEESIFKYLEKKEEA